MIVVSAPIGTLGGATLVTVGAAARIVRFTCTLVCGSIRILPAYWPGLRPVGSTETVTIAGVVGELLAAFSQEGVELGVKVNTGVVLVTLIVCDGGTDPPTT